MAPSVPGAHFDEAPRRVAHNTPPPEDPTEISPDLTELTKNLASLARSLHQIAESHDGAFRARALVAGDTRTERAAAYQVSWELHRAAEMVHQVANGLTRAHDIEATIAYDIHDSSALDAVPRRANDPGLSL